MLLGADIGADDMKRCLRRNVSPEIGFADNGPSAYDQAGAPGGDILLDLACQGLVSRQL